MRGIFSLNRLFVGYESMERICAGLLSVALICLVAGVFVLAGAGWALISASVSLMLVAGMISRGHAQRLLVSMDANPT